MFRTPLIRLLSISSLLWLSACARMPAIAPDIGFGALASFWETEKSEAGKQGVKSGEEFAANLKAEDANTAFPRGNHANTSHSQFLKGLSKREIRSLKHEAWRHYGRFWKGVATRSRYVRQPLLETLERHGFPRELQMVPVVESSYDPYAHSTAGAAGLWQLMPVTASDMNIKNSKYFDGRRDIRISTKAAARYLTKQYRRFGNWEMAFAAYHLGPSAVQRRLNRRAWKPEDGLRRMPLPPITKTYIRHILGLIALHEDGLIKFPAPYPTKTLQVQTPIDLDELHAKAELPENQIFRFNPHLKLNQYADSKPGALRLRISAWRAPKVKASLPKKPVETMTITVAHGDSLVDISRRYSTSVQFVRANNPGLETPLVAGQQLRLPVKVIKRQGAEENPMIKPVARQQMLADNSGTRI